VIEVQHLHKRFGAVVAVDDVSFKAEDGRVTGLLGPNGAGKTTTIRMITSLVVPDRGAAKVDGIDVAESPIAARTKLGVLPDARGIYPRLTARENVRYYGELHGLSGPELERRIDDLCETLDMKSIDGRRAEGFSQGERVKVALARSLVHGPRNVLLDEPTNGLDVMSTRALRAFIRKLREEGKCVVFSTHVMQEVAALCDRIVVVARGRVVADGTKEELLSQTKQTNLEEAFVAIAGEDAGGMA